MTLLEVLIFAGGFALGWLFCRWHLRPLLQAQKKLRGKISIEGLYNLEKEVDKTLRDIKRKEGMR